VDRRILEALGRDGNLVNVARGTIVVEDDLIEALTTNRIAAAGLDVFEDEPAIRPEFAKLANVVLSPHVAAYTHRSARETSEIFLANLRSYLAGRESKRR
jgi:lactate dehydrogenase-like 2-hydroxyacid dehydrogenase